MFCFVPFCEAWFLSFYGLSKAAFMVDHLQSLTNEIKRQTNREYWYVLNILIIDVIAAIV